MQKAMLAITTSGKGYHEWDQSKITALLAEFHTTDGHSLTHAVLHRIRAKIRDVCKVLRSFPARQDRDAELDWVYAEGQEEMDSLPRLPKKWDKYSDTLLPALKEYARSRMNAPPASHDHHAAGHTAESIAIEKRELELENLRLRAELTYLRLNLGYTTIEKQELAGLHAEIERLRAQVQYVTLRLDEQFVEPDLDAVSRTTSELEREDDGFW